MKYIIELEDEPMIANSFHQEVDELWKAKGLNSLVFDQNGIKKLTPYTEPNRKAIEDEVWKFAKKIGSFNGLSKHELDKCFGHTTIQGVMTTHDAYSEAKAKFKVWSKQNIRTGDEVIYNSRTKAVVLIPETKEKYGTILTDDFATVVVSHDELEKTGRHFSDIEELLKKMRGEE